jgi:hypothetical protein
MGCAGLQDYCVIKRRFPFPFALSLSEGRSFFIGSRRKGQCFGKLSTNGFGGS